MATCVRIHEVRHGRVGFELGNSVPWLALAVFLLRLDLRLEEGDGVATPLAPKAPFESLHRGDRALVIGPIAKEMQRTRLSGNILLA